MTTLNQQPPPRFRLRLMFAKRAAIKYISHLDLSLAWERALRRAGIPLAYSRGFNPRPKLQFASGLPLGTTGTAEILDILVTEKLEPNQVAVQLQTALPQGIDLHSVTEVPLRSPALQPLLRQAIYTVVVETDLTTAKLTERIDRLLAAEQIIQTRRRRQKEEQYDLRPWLYELRLVAVAKAEAHFHMKLAAGQSGNLRPQEVLKALDLAENWADIERIGLIFADELVLQK